MSDIRILVADEQELVRAGLARLIERLKGVEIVGEAGDGHAALALAERLRPDLVLLDSEIPGLHGLDVAVRLSALEPPAATLMLSTHDSEEHVLLALRAGCAGYLLKRSAVKELESAVRAVSRGELYLSPAVPAQVAPEFARRAGRPSPPVTSLTQRQREILSLVAEGHTSREVATRLGLSVKTVETHRTHIMERLGVRDVTGLVRYAVKVGLVNP